MKVYAIVMTEEKIVSPGFKQRDEILSFEFEIPDEGIKKYAIEVLELMTEKMAVDYVNDNPPEREYGDPD